MTSPPRDDVGATALRKSVLWGRRAGGPEGRRQGTSLGSNLTLCPLEGEMTFLCGGRRWGRLAGKRLFSAGLITGAGGMFVAKTLLSRWMQSETAVSVLDLTLGEGDYMPTVLELMRVSLSRDSLCMH